MIVLIVRRMQILKAKETDQRAALFARAIKSGQDMQAANRKLLLRMRLYAFRRLFVACADLRV